MKALARQSNGTLLLTDAFWLDGEVVNNFGDPLRRTEQTTTLAGWPFVDARIYTNDAGVEFLLPEPLPAPSTPEGINKVLRRIEAAAGDYVASARNPTGLAAYYDKGDAKPWRIADDHTAERYASADEAEAGAAAWANAMESA